MNPVNRIIFDKLNFKDENEFWQTVNEQSKLLMKAGYCTVLKFDTNVKSALIIDFVPNDVNIGDPYPYFLYPFEAKMLRNYHDKILEKSMSAFGGMNNNNEEDYEDEEDEILDDKMISEENKKGDA